MKAYVFACRGNNNGNDYIFSQVHPTYEEAWKNACRLFNESCNVSEILEVEI